MQRYMNVDDGGCAVSLRLTSEKINIIIFLPSTIFYFLCEIDSVLHAVSVSLSEHGLRNCKNIDTRLIYAGVLVPHSIILRSRTTCSKPVRYFVVRLLMCFHDQLLLLVSS